MNDPRTCPKCGGTLPANAPSGVCPKCLMLAGLAAEDADLSGSGNAYAVTTPQPPGAGGFNPPPAASLAALFPQLEILEVLGHGGMGAVYKARQSKLDRIVALKIIRPESADDPAFAERFNREARTLARLNHPHIVAVHDFGEVQLADPQQGGQSRPLYYFVMEYVDGANLRQLMETRSVGPDQALAIIRQICEALQFAHDEGIVHRDIKPENVLIDTRGRVKIADFGLAKLAARTPGDFTLTATHQVMGTPRYMAPEQMTGSHHVDHRADIYSLGVVFYELLTGEVPMGQFEPPSKRAPVDARLDGIVMRALAREPDRRFQQASEMKSSVDIISSATVIQPAEQSPLPPHGASTIVEREIANAWRWMAGTSVATPEAAPHFPTLLALLLAVAGSLMVLLPWMDVTIIDVSGASGSSGVALADVAEPTPTDTASVMHAMQSRPADVRHARFGIAPARTILAQDAAVATDSAASSESLMDNTLVLQPGETVTLHGSDVWPGLAASAVFAFIALLVLMLPPRLLSRWDWNLPIVILSGVTLMMPALYWMEVDGSFVSHSAPLPPSAPPAVQAPSVSVEESREVGNIRVQHTDGPRSDNDWVSLKDVKHRITYRQGFYGSIGLGLCLLVLSARGVRRGISEAGPTGIQPAHAGSPVARIRFATSIRENLGQQVITHFESHGYRLHERGPDRWVFQRGSKMAGLFATDIRVYDTQLSVRTSPVQPGRVSVTCLWEIRTLGAVITQKDITVLEAEGRELEAVLNESAPPAPSEFAAAPSGTQWHASSLAAAGVAAATSSPGASLSGLPHATDTGVGIDLDEVYSELEGPSLSMMAIGVMMMIAHAILAYIAGTQPREPEFALLAIPGIVTGLGMVVGGFNLRRLRSRGWSQLGVISGFIPFSPGWLVGCPISVWASMAMNRPHVLAGFTEQRRLRARLAALPGQPRYSRKAILGAVWAGLFILLVVPGVMLSFVAMPATAESPQVSLRMVTLLALPILMAPVGTTILGCMAIGDIRHSKGRIYGMGLAVADALLFPLLLLNGALFAGFMYFNIEVLNMRELGLAVFISLGSTVAFGTAISVAIVKTVWKNENRSTEPTGNS